MDTYRVLKGLWYDGWDRRCWWKLQKKTWIGWKTIYWTTFNETVRQWVGRYGKMDFEFDQTWK